MTVHRCLLLRPHRLHRVGSLFLIFGLVLALCLGGAQPAAAQDEPVPDRGSSLLFLPALATGENGVVAAGTIIPGQYIVTLATSEVQSSAAFAADVVAQYGGTVLYVYDSALSGFAAELPEVAAAELAANPNVAAIEPNRVVRTIATQSPATWGLDRIDQRALPLNNTYVYNVTGSGVHAYIIDTGILATHNEFGGRVSGGYTAINDGNGTKDCNGHGTHVAGTVGGSTYGVAKSVALHPVRVLNCSGSGTTAGVIAGVDWVTANRVLPAVANMSLGGGLSSALNSAVTNAVNAGVTFAVAAGNDNRDACRFSPASAPAAITVGATTSTDSRASYSNYGSCLDIFAPGSSITSAWYTGNTATNTISGTSMASPHVAGAAALYLAVNPGASPAQVTQALTSNATLNVVGSAGRNSPNRLLFTGLIGN